MFILAVGIGVNAAVFTLVQAALFNGFRLVEHNDQMLYVYSTSNGQYSGVSYPDFLDWQSEAKSFTGGMGLVGDLKAFCDDGSGAADVCHATRITAHGFRLLGREPLLGRSFSDADDVAGATPVAILSYAFWDRQFGRDPKIVGKSLRLRSTEDTSLNAPSSSAARGTPPTTIIGVTPEGFAFPQYADLWVPLVPTTPDAQQRDARSEWFAFGRLAPGATRASAQAELDTIAQRLAATYPRTDTGQKPRVETFAEFFVDPNAPLIYRTLWAAVAFVLLIACANLGNLSLGRATDRAREMAIRVAIGAGKWRIVRQLLTESLVLSAIGGACGWVIGEWAVRIYALATNPPVGTAKHDLLDYSMDARVFAYVSAISLAAGVLFGLAPALWASRADLNGVMRDGGRSINSGHQTRRISAALVIAEVSLAMVLMVGAGLMIRSCLRMYTADIGAQTKNLAGMLLRLPPAKYSDRERDVSFCDRLESNVEALPGIASMTIGAAPASSTGVRLTPYDVYGETVDAEHRPRTAIRIVGPDYFRTVDTAVLAGREFARTDRGSAPLVAIVNERFAHLRWPGARAVGQRIRLGDGADPPQWLTIVGVVGNVMYDFRHQQITPIVYVPYAQTSGADDPWLPVLVRTSVAPERVLQDLRREVTRVDADVLVWNGPSVEQDQFALSVDGRTGHEAALLLLFAAIALLLSTTGLYAVVAQSVTRRVPEIGVRAAMGASPRDIRAMVFTQGMRPVAVGLAIGVATALIVGPVLRSELVGIVPADPTTMIVGAAALLVSAALACTIPARRATRIDPIVALRQE